MARSGLYDLVWSLRRRAARDSVAAVSCGDLLERFIQSRDELAFEELVYRHGPRVYAVCRRLVGDRQRAEDAFQAAFVVLARKAETVRPREAVGGFLYGVARRCAQEAMAMSRRRRREVLVSEMPDVPRVDDVRVDSDALALLDAEIADLSESLRAAVVLCELDGLSRSEAARRLGIAEGTLSSRLAAARKRLASRLARRGVVFSSALMSSLTNSLQAAVPVSLLETTARIASGALSPVPIAIADGVLNMMLASKLKLAGLVLATLVGLGLIIPGGSTETAAAPVPKEKSDAGLIWVFNRYTAVLSAYTPEGTVEKKWTLPEGDRFLGLTPDGTKIMFAGKKGKVVDANVKEWLTLHVRDIGEGREGKDLGVGWQPRDQFVWSPDGQRVVRVRLRPAFGGAGTATFDNALFDLESGREDHIDLPVNQQVKKWSSDGRVWWVMEMSALGDPKLPAPRWHAFYLRDGHTRPIEDKYSIMEYEHSPDGESLLATGYRHPPEKSPGFYWFRVNIESGKFTEVKKFESTAYSVGRWSPDGKRVAFLAYGRDAEKSEEREATLTVYDADGRDEKRIAGFGPNQATRFLGWFPSKPPKQEESKDPGVVWLYDAASGLLENYRPDGEKLKEWKLDCGYRFRGVTPDGTRFAYVNDASKHEMEKTRLFLRALDAEATETKLRVRGEPIEELVWSADGKCYGEMSSKSWVFFRSYGPGDRTTETRGGPCRIVGMGPTGHLHMMLSLDSRDEKRRIHMSRLRAFDFCDGDEHYPEAADFDSPRLSPDGKFLLGFDAATTAEKRKRSVRILELLTRKTDKFDLPEGAVADRGVWSWDGKRVAYRWTDEAVKGKVHFTVRDRDGKNATNLATVESSRRTELQAWTPTPHFLIP